MLFGVIQYDCPESEEKLLGQFYCVCSVRAWGDCGESRRERSYMPVQTRSRSDKNAAVHKALKDSA